MSHKAELKIANSHIKAELQHRKTKNLSLIKRLCLNPLLYSYKHKLQYILLGLYIIDQHSSVLLSSESKIVHEPENGAVSASSPPEPTLCRDTFPWSFSSSQIGLICEHHFFSSFHRLLLGLWRFYLEICFDLKATFVNLTAFLVSSSEKRMDFMPK